MGAAATAQNLGVSPLVVGLTIVGFGTSAPEMLVSSIAAYRGAPDLSVGNAVGSGLGPGVGGRVSKIMVPSVTADEVGTASKVVLVAVDL